MNTYKVKTQFIIEGTFEVTADTEAEARDKVKRYCGIAAGWNVYCTMSEKVKHRFRNYPIKKITEITIKK